MKRSFVYASFLGAAMVIVSCNDRDRSASTSSDSSYTTTTSATDPIVDTPAAPANTITNTPLTGEDSSFALEAASGGRMEVELGNLAQQHAQSDRVKAFGAMMVRDHTAANNQLMSIASAKSFAIPDSMMKMHRDHVASMRKLKGRSFDRAYVQMMVKDHEEDITKFERASTGAMDANLRSFASTTLPTLRVHRDSINAIKKAY